MQINISIDDNNNRNGFKIEINKLIKYLKK